MNQGDYQLMAIAGISLLGYIASRSVEVMQRKVVRRFVERANQCYIPRIKQLNDSISRRTA